MGKCIAMAKLENDILSRKVKSSEGARTREVSNIKNLYKNELDDLRKQLFDTAMERDELWMELQLLQIERDGLIARIMALELRVQYFEARSKQAACDKQKPEGKLQLHEKELVEVKRTQQVEIAELDGRLQGEYEQKLPETLRELREDYEKQAQGSQFRHGAPKEEIFKPGSNKLKSTLEPWLLIQLSACWQLLGCCVPANLALKAPKYCKSYCPKCQSSCPFRNHLVSRILADTECRSFDRKEN